jgi:hypothetical protein
MPEGTQSCGMPLAHGPVVQTARGIVDGHTMRIISGVSKPLSCCGMTALDQSEIIRVSSPGQHVGAQYYETRRVTQARCRCMVLLSCYFSCKHWDAPVCIADVVCSWLKVASQCGFHASSCTRHGCAGLGWGLVGVGAYQHVVVCLC